MDNEDARIGTEIEEGISIYAVDEDGQILSVLVQGTIGKTLHRRVFSVSVSGTYLDTIKDARDWYRVLTGRLSNTIITRGGVIARDSPHPSVLRARQDVDAVCLRYGISRRNVQ